MQHPSHLRILMQSNCDQINPFQHFPSSRILHLISTLSIHWIVREWSIYIIWVHSFYKLKKEDRLKKKNATVSILKFFFFFFYLRQDLGFTVPIASPKALLQLELTFSPRVEDFKSILFNLMSVQATFSLQLKLSATSDVDVPCISE